MAPSPNDARRPATVLDAVSRLIELATTSRDGNLPVITLLRDWLQGGGAITHVLREEDRKNANLIAIIPGAAEGALELLPEPARISSDQLSRDLLGDAAGRGKGGLDQLVGAPSSQEPAGDAVAEHTSPGGERRGILLAGHADCVPVDGQDWSTDPFTPTVREDRLYGRGTCDMKAYLGIAAHLADEFAAAPLTEPIIIAATWEEETTCNGARELVKQLRALGLAPRIAFVGEPTMMDVICGHKSMNVFRADFYGIAAHSSLLPRGLNSIRYASAFTTWFHEEIIDRLIADGPADDAFPVPHTTGGVNVITGGNASNTVPAHTQLEFEFRALPGMDVPAVVRRIDAKIQEIDAAMRAAIPEEPADPAAAQRVGAELTINSLLYPLAADGDCPAAQLAEAAGQHVQTQKVTYGTEAGIYENAGISTVVIGPGDIAQAHGADEYVALSQIDACETFFRALLTQLADP